jgi:predicted nucleic acid-binding protein
VAIVLDAWALVAVLKREAAGPRVRGVIERGEAVACSINLGEVFYSQARDIGEQTMLFAVEQLRRQLTIVDPDWPLVRTAALVKARNKLSYADAFCVATAQRLRAPLWTGDPEIIALAGEVEVVDLR